MRLRLLSLMLCCVAAAVMRAGVPAGLPAQQATSVGMSVGVLSPLKGRAHGSDMRPSVSIDFARRFTPALGLGVEGLIGFNTSRWPSATHSSTAVDLSYLGVYGSWDVVSLLRPASRLSAGLELGLGWGHTFNTGARHDHNFIATRLGAYAGYSLSRAFALWLSPSFMWDLSDAATASSSAAFSSRHCIFMLRLGLRYCFGRPLLSPGDYCAARVEALNGEVNSLRRQVDSLSSVIREEAVDNRLNTVHDVFFRSGSAVIEPDQIPTVERVAGSLNNRPGTSVLIDGYASSEGSDTANRRLALDRATAVRDMLVDRFKVDPARITARGLGVGHIFSEESWNRVAVCTITASADH